MSTWVRQDYEAMLAHARTSLGELPLFAAYAAAGYPVLALTFQVDELLLESGSRMLHEAYTGAQVDYCELAPGQFNLSRIGHVGFFKNMMQDTLWPLVGAWLAQRMAASAA